MVPVWAVVVVLIAALVGVAYQRAQRRFHSRTNQRLLDELQRGPDASKGGNVALVIAHPDDESMFFVPTLRYLVTHCRAPPHVLCLSNGNSAGLGKSREKELYGVMKLLGIPSSHLTIIDDERLPDSLTSTWSHTVITSHLSQFISDTGSSTLLTFDSVGVSGHANHRALCHAINRYLYQKPTLQAYELLSLPLFTKYLSLASVLTLPSDGAVTLMIDPLLNWKCMSAHASQFVWYRRLFLLFSSYTFLNVWQKM